MTDRDRGAAPAARFLRADVLTARPLGRPIEGAFSVSVVLHALGVIVLALLVSPSPADNRRSTATSSRIVWLPGDPHGGGGTGESQPEPARKIEMPGRDAMMVPAVRGESRSTDTPLSNQTILMPAVATMADVRDLPGIVTPVSLVSSDLLGPAPAIEEERAAELALDRVMVRASAPDETADLETVPSSSEAE